MSRSLCRAAARPEGLPGIAAIALLLSLVGAGCQRQPEIVEVRAFPSIVCPGDTALAETISRNIDGGTMRSSSGERRTLPGNAELTATSMEVGPLCTDAVIDAEGTLGERSDTGSAVIEVIAGEAGVGLLFEPDCGCVDRSRSEFRGYRPVEVTGGRYSDSLLVLGARNDSAVTVTLTHEGLSDRAAAGASFPAFSGTGVVLVGTWGANPDLLAPPGSVYSCCVAPTGPVEPEPLPGSVRLIGYPLLPVQLVAGCPAPAPEVCPP